MSDHSPPKRKSVENALRPTRRRRAADEDRAPSTANTAHGHATDGDSTARGSTARDSTARGSTARDSAHGALVRGDSSRGDSSRAEAVPSGSGDAPVGTSGAAESSPATTWHSEGVTPTATGSDIPSAARQPASSKAGAPQDASAADSSSPPSASQAAAATSTEPVASFADMFDDSDVPRRQKLSVGDAFEGPVVHVGADGAFVDLGGHQQGFYPRLALDVLDTPVEAGTRLRGHVVRLADDGTPELGSRLGKGMRAQDLEAALREELPVEGKVSGVNRGGVNVDLGGLRAFCPIGQLDRGFVSDPSVFLQQTLRFLVLELRDGKDVVLSRKKLMQKEDAAQRDDVLAELVVGARRTGTVRSVRDFGAFVELGAGIDGLIPTRELSHDHRRAEQVVSTGQTVEVLIQEVREEKGELRVTLSLKALAADPWDQVDRVASVGQVATGVVRRLMDFGAFVELAPGIEGLLHVGELGAGARHPSTYVSVGEPLLVTVQSVDRERKRISLAPAPKGATAGQRVSGDRVQVGDIVDTVVDRVERFGVFVQIDGVPGRAGRGLIHERELGVAHGVDIKKAFPEGSKVQAKVIATDRLALSIKAIVEDEARREVDAYKSKQGNKGLGTLGDLLGKL